MLAAHAARSQRVQPRGSAEPRAEIWRPVAGWAVHWSSVPPATYVSVRIPAVAVRKQPGPALPPSVRPTTTEPRLRRRHRSHRLFGPAQRYVQFQGRTQPAVEPAMQQGCLVPAELRGLESWLAGSTWRLHGASAPRVRPWACWRHHHVAAQILRRTLVASRHLPTLQSAAVQRKIQTLPRSASLSLPLRQRPGYWLLADRPKPLERPPAGFAASAPGVALQVDQRMTRHRPGCCPRPLTASMATAARR